MKLSVRGSIRPRPSATAPLVAALLCASLVGGCHAPSALDARGESSVPVVDDVPVARPPYQSVATEWKERLDQPYVFLEIVGPYQETGRFMDELRQHVESQGLRSNGPPFALFYDDPMRVPPQQCRSRLAVPVAPGTAVAAPLGYAVLPGGRVVYAHVAGRYDGVSAAYPAMFEVLRSRNWVLETPIREIYLVDPTSVASFDELVTEIQMPWRQL